MSFLLIGFTNYFFIIMPVIIPTLVLIWLLIKKNKKAPAKTIKQEQVSIEEPIQIDEQLTFKNENIEASETKPFPFKIADIKESASYYYKVYEEHNGDNDEQKQYQKTYFFKNGNLLKQKFDAEDWYNRRKAAISNKQMLYHANQNSEIKFGVKLYLVDCLNGEIDYLLKDEYGINNSANRQFEALVLEKGGFDISGYSNHISPRNSYDSKNTYLGW